VIHIEPCSCELHVRIRELEAELLAATGVSKLRRGSKRLWTVADERRWAAANESVSQLRARAEKAEARVAELIVVLARESKGED
jgi:hypothetical protein